MDQTQEQKNTWSRLGSALAMKNHDAYIALVIESTELKKRGASWIEIYDYLIAGASDRLGIYNGKHVDAGASEYAEIMEMQELLNDHGHQER